MVIATVLSRGSWAQVEWLFDHYGTAKVRQVFLDDYYGPQSLSAPTGPGPLAKWRCRHKVPRTLTP